MLKFFQIFLIAMPLTGCTCSIMLTDSHGTDNDVDSSPKQETDTVLTAPAVKPFMV